jgi:hypothetical protein
MDDHSTHLELDLNFWLETGSTGGLDINLIYGTCAPPRRSPGFGEDLPLSPPLTSMYLIIFFKINITIFFFFLLF